MLKLRAKRVAEVGVAHAADTEGRSDATDTGEHGLEVLALDEAHALGHGAALVVVQVEPQQVQRRGHELHGRGAHELREGAGVGLLHKALLLDVPGQHLGGVEGRSARQRVAHGEEADGREREGGGRDDAEHARKGAVLGDAERHVDGRGADELGHLVVRLGVLADRVHDVGGHVRGRVEPEDEVELALAHEAQRVLEEVEAQLAQAAAQRPCAAGVLDDGAVHDGDEGRHAERRGHGGDGVRHELLGQRGGALGLLLEAGGVRHVESVVRRRRASGGGLLERGEQRAGCACPRDEGERSRA
ncbi:hypothetical protein ON010_g10938 [Phytophthora cinnamomi]|nr:hypothetical protein ON010_g10938 [Phytophthora cinnamomi]